MNANDSEGLARALFVEAGDALFLFDPQTDQLLDVNPMAERLTDFPRAEMLRLPATYLFRYGGKGGMQRLRQACHETMVFHAQDGFYLRNRQDGVWVPVNLTVTRLHVQPRTLALITARDVRERHETQARLQEAEGELRRVLASVSDCLWSARLDGAGRWEYRYLSPVVERITGRSPAFFLAGPDCWADLVHPEDRPRWRSAGPSPRRPTESGRIPNRPAGRRRPLGARQRPGQPIPKGPRRKDKGGIDATARRRFLLPEAGRRADRRHRSAAGRGTVPADPRRRSRGLRGHGRRRRHHRLEPAGRGDVRLDASGGRRPTSGRDDHPGPPP